MAKKILHLITNLGVGGAETMLVSMLEQFFSGAACPKNHPVVFFRDGPMRRRLEKIGVPVFMIRGLFSRYDPIAIHRLIRIVKKFKPDIIHSSLWASNLVARFIGYFLSIPVICDLHSDCEHYGLIRRIIDHVPIPRPSACVAVTDHVRRSFMKTLDGKRVRDVRVIYNGISERFSFSLINRERLRKNIPESTFIVGAVGRLAPIKRYDLLIEAFSQLVQPSLLWIVGSGKELSRLQKTARRSGCIDRIRFVGEVGNVVPWYSAFDCLAVSSDSEGLSLAVLEALSSGLPVITPGYNKLHDVVTTGKNGIVLPSNSAKNILCGLEKIKKISIFTNQRKSLLDNKFSLNHVVNYYNNLYEDISNGF